MTTALAPSYRDERIWDPDWLSDPQTYREFYNSPRQSNYFVEEMDPLYYGRLEFAKLFAAGRVLDVGCNGGKFDFELARSGLSVVGTDISAAYIAEDLDRLFGEPDEVQLRLTFRQAAAEDLQYEGEFDTVMVLDVLQHVIDPAVVVANAFRALNADGIALITVPAAGGLYEQHPDHDEHVRRFSRENVVALLEDAGAAKVSAWTLPGQHVLAVALKSDTPAARARITDAEFENLMQRQLLIGAIIGLGEVQAAYDRACAILADDPEDLPMRFRIALLLSQVGEVDAALQMAEPLMDHPSFATRTFYRWLGQVLVAVGRYGDAANAFELAIRSSDASEDDWIGTLWEV